MSEMKENDKPLGRREMLSASAIASLAFTAGLIGVATIASGQTVTPIEGVKPKFYNPPKRTASPSIQKEKSNYSNKELEALKAKLKELLAKHCQLSSQDSLEKIDNRKFLRIESFISIDPVNQKKIEQNFLSTHVEILLDQAANLLDRGLKDRAEWDDKAIKNLSLAFELKEFFELDDIHKEETEEGFYEQEVQSLQNQLAIELLNKNNLQLISQYFDDVFKYRWTKEMQSVSTEAYGEIAKLSNWRYQGTNPAQDIKNMTNYVVEHNQAIQFVNNFIQNNGYLSALEFSKKRCENLQQKLDWEIKNREFRLRRTDVTRKYQYLKSLSYQAEDGILNYCKRLDPLSERFTKDFEDAYGRLTVASKGIKSIFGYSNPLPVKDNSVDFFDKCVIWNRDAINWLIKFSRLDQSYVFPISLKNILNAAIYKYHDSQDGVDKSLSDLWNTSLKKGKFEFSIDESFFENQKHIRIKGISIFVHLRPKKGKQQSLNLINGTVIADVKVPEVSHYTHLDGHVENVDQRSIPSLRIGRISTRDFVRTPEICGVSILNNASPLGKWILVLPQIEKGNLNEFIYIDDIYIDLLVTMRSMK